MGAKPDENSAFRQPKVAMLATGNSRFGGSGGRVARSDRWRRRGAGIGLNQHSAAGGPVPAWQVDALCRRGNERQEGRTALTFSGGRAAAKANRGGLPSPSGRAQGCDSTSTLKAGRRTQTLNNYQLRGHFSAGRCRLALMLMTFAGQ